MGDGVLGRQFDGELLLAVAVTRAVRLVRSHMPGFDDTRMRLEGVLDFSSCVIVEECGWIGRGSRVR